MRTNVPVSIIMVLLCCSILLAACGGREKKPTLDPSVANKQVFDSVVALVRKGQITDGDQFIAARNRVSAGIIAKVKADSLQGQPLLDYGQLLYWSGQEQKARQAFETLRNGKDKHAAAAWKELITMEIEAKNYPRAEAMLKEYRAAIPPDTSDTFYLFEQCLSLVSGYDEAGDEEAAMRVRMDELNALPFDVPYQSFSFVTSAVEQMMGAGRVAEGRALLESYRGKWQKALALHLKNVPADSAAKEEDAIAAGFKSLINDLATCELQLGLTGKKAPGFTFLHVYNADATITLEKLKGKVVMLDFWATWCMPCVIGFAEARRLYDDYKDKGFEIVGITSFQGMYQDKDSGVSEGTKEQPLDRAREIELTEAYIKKHGIIWPCAFSDRPVFDPYYGITGIPTFVLLDRDGIVRYISTGIGQEKQKRRVIEKLMAN
jgi:thiol-disulfide isomerase/thioredoxin